MATPPFMTFKRKQEDFKKLVGRLHAFSGLDKAFVANIAMYAYSLPQKGTYDIDELVFTAEMLTTFGLDDPLNINRMYATIKSSKDPKTKVSVEDFCRLICIFLCEDLDKKVDFVFKVYDINNDDEIDQQEMYNLLRATVVKMVEDYAELDESLREIIDVVMQSTDMDKNKVIDLEEFRALVKRNILMLQCLGPCLPHRQEIESFTKKIKGLDKEDVAEMFKNEREKVLREKKNPRHKSVYPIRMEMI